MLFDSWPRGAGHSDKEKNGLSKYWVSFSQCLVSLFSFLPPPPATANVGGSPERWLGVTHCAAR